VDYEAGNKDVEMKRRQENAKKTAQKRREKQQSEADPQRKRNRKYQEKTTQITSYKGINRFNS
jgi:hypothetical protein